MSDDLQITEAELASLTRDMVEMHHQTLPGMHQAAAEWQEISTQLRGGPSRRTFLVGVGAVVSAAALAACSSSKSPGSSTSTSAPKPTTAPGQGLTGDLAIAALAAAIENTAVATYGKGIDAVTSGALKAPPAVVTFAQTAQTQHKDHAAAWNAILTGAGQPAIPASYLDTTVYTGVVAPAFAKVKDVAGLANLALTLENVAAATYLAGIGLVTSTGALKVAATIQPVEMQHAAILNFVLGTYPIPDSFAKTDLARGLTDQIGTA